MEDDAHGSGPYFAIPTQHAAVKGSHTYQVQQACLCVGGGGREGGSWCLVEAALHRILAALRSSVSGSIVSY